MPGVTFYRDPTVPFLEIKLCDDKNLSYKRHFHEEYSIGVIDEGSSQVWCDGENLNVEAGNFLWIPPYLSHACNPDESSSWRYKMLFLNPQWVKQVSGDRADFQEPVLVDSVMSKRMNVVLDQIILCLQNHGSPMESETLAMEMLHCILKSSIAEEKRPEDGQAKLKLKKVRDYLHEHFLERLTLDELEQVSGMSRYHLIHLFKKQHNVPPHAYQNLLRINFAKKELGKQRPITEVASEAGFYDQSHFTKSFKSFVGITPQKYIKSR